MGYHIAIVPDGNRRYARSHDMNKREGHEQGLDRAKDLIRDLDDGEYDVDIISLWGLSRDNAQKRDKLELKYLNSMFRGFTDLKDEFIERGIDFRIVGDMDKIEDETQKQLKSMEQDVNGDGLQLNLLLGYDGKYDIVQAARRSAHSGCSIDEDDIEDNLLIDELDIVVGYGADRAHISTFANWQLSYSTLVFPHKNFPAAELSDLEEAIETHRNRKNSRGA